jgi:DNA-binding response OmpR family regulator
VVEDDAVLRGFLVDHLTVEHRVATATSAEDAIAVVDRIRPDLVVCDLQLPGAGGEHLVRRLRSDPELAGLPVVVVSGRNDDEQRVRVLRAGIDDYVLKPFSPDELVARISNLLAKSVDLDDLRDRASRAQQVAEQLQRALESRIVIEQAKAFVAADRGIDVGEAFDVLRRYARSHNVKLHELAAAVVEGFRP